jgi:hypothetical protein
LPIEPGTKLGHFEVQDLIGQGAMGLVYRAYHAELARTGAVKVLQAISPDADSTARFRREARSIAQMRHPNILNVFDFGEYEGTPYMIVEFVAGGTLLGRMHQKPLEHSIALRYLRGIADALDYAHAIGVVHRDVKPANVLLGTEDDPILADFGLAKLLQGSGVRSMTGVTTGTPAYMAPEQVTGSQVGPPADMYSLASIAYEMLTGFIPFEGEGVLELLYAQVHRYPPPPSARDKALGPGVDAVIMRGLAKDPALRWESCNAFVDALAGALAGKGPALDKTLVTAPPVVSVRGPVQGRAAVATPLRSEPAMAATGAIAAPAVTLARKSHRLRNALIAIGAIALLLILSVIGYAATHPQPAMSLSTTTIQAGNTLIVSASHVPANQAGEVELLSQVHSYAFRADASGNVNVEVVVPKDIGIGDHLVKLCWAGSCHVTMSLRITASPFASPTPSPRLSPTPGRTPTLPSITLSTNTVRVGGAVTITGKDFDSSKPVTIAMLQDKVVKTLVTQPINPHPDGTYVVTVTIPSGINPGSAEIVACSYTPGQSGSSSGQCGAQPVTVVR